MTFCVLLFDIDHFKKVNDTYGHDVGDKVLSKVAQVANANIMQTDFIFRYGGEEFIVLLPHTSKNEGEEIAEKIRMAIEDIFKRADEALYQAKYNGRNQVVVI